MIEKWKSVNGFESLYEVSNMGNVRNLRKGRLMKQHENTVGYLQVILCKNGKPYYKCVHKLVAEAFIDNPRSCNEVNHIDENKQNNNAENLAWCTHRENILHGTCIERAKKTRKENSPAQKVLAIFPDNTTHCYASAKEASEKLGISESGIRSVLCGCRMKYLGTRWFYLNR